MLQPRELGMSLQCLGRTDICGQMDACGEDRSKRRFRARKGEEWRQEERPEGGSLLQPVLAVPGLTSPCRWPRGAAFCGRLRALPAAGSKGPVGSP